MMKSKPSVNGLMKVHYPTDCQIFGSNIFIHQSSDYLHFAKHDNTEATNKMSKIKPRIYKGTRDFLPEQMVRRNYVINIIKTVFEKFGFEQLETPTIEMWETLSGKYGEEGDRLTYRFTDRGDREVGLRYDLTVPLSRVVAMYPQLPKPFKRYQIQPVWRADKPKKGASGNFISVISTPSAANPFWRMPNYSPSRRKF